jgi:hypothetical protein
VLVVAHHLLLWQLEVSQQMVCLVSSAQIRSTSVSTSTARVVMSFRFPNGVATK